MIAKETVGGPAIETSSDWSVDLAGALIRVSLFPWSLG